MSKRALYLAGGGARGAYQAGVLKAIYQILQVPTLPFSLVSGVSVGSINAAILSQYSDDFQLGVTSLEDLWCNIKSQDIFNASNYELSKSVVKNVSNIFYKQKAAGHLFNTDPLQNFIQTNVNFQKISHNIAHGYLDTIEILSNCYETQQTISFYQHRFTNFEDWHYPRHSSRAVELSKDHIMASGALPLFFPVIKIDSLHYGDGSMGLVSPLRGTVRFGVEKVMILGTRCLPSAQEQESFNNSNIGLAYVLGNMLNSVFLDNLDRDIEMVNHMNDIAQLLSVWKKRRSPWRPIETLHLRPSLNIASIAQEKYKAMPALLRTLLNLLGAQSHSGDLLSFLLFEKEFTQALVALGYQDALNNSKAITAFFA